MPILIDEKGTVNMNDFLTNPQLVLSRAVFQTHIYLHLTPESLFFFFFF